MIVNVHQLRIKVPVSLHTVDDVAGNRDSAFVVRVPLDEPDLVARLRVIRAETALRKSQHDARDLHELLDQLSRASPGLRRWVARLQSGARAFALNVSNVCGPAHDVTVLGAPAQALYSLVEVAPHHVLRVAVLSLAERLCVGLVADPAAVPDIAGLAAAIEQEATELAAAVQT